VSTLRTVALATLLGWPALACVEPPVFQKGFTRILIAPRRNAGRQPGEWQLPQAPAPEQQALLYRAALEVFWPEPWLFGFYWWQWDVRPPRDPAHDIGYTPQGKPAAAVLHDFYGRAAPSRPKLRFLLASLGAAHIDGMLRLESDGATLAEYDVNKTFAWGGVYGAATEMSEIEQGFAERAAALIVGAE
jgi:hypothetical protein